MNATPTDVAKPKSAQTPLIRECETAGCATLTLGGLCVACETELGITFPYFGRGGAARDRPSATSTR
jgi:hypothetical protein